MAYSDIALLSSDVDFYARTAAAYAVESLNDPAGIAANQWAQQHSWDMAAQPGFGEAYAYAVATGVERPGNDPAVITDGQILAAVQSLIPEPTPPEGV
jgi:hypothetical protein